ncbi:MAG: hypothetical protein NC826_06840, partial [Candidatus Omnitrophica bacterium]|nr:hypothetical protein [Candidatus Omnitrophota bacterium]
MLNCFSLSYYALIGLFNFITAFLLSFFVFSKNPRSRSNQTLSLWLFTVAGWGLFYFLWLTTKKSHLAEFYLRTLMLFVIFIPSTFTHFVLTLFKVDFRKKVDIFNYLISILLGFSAYTPFFANEIGSFLVFPYWLKPKFLFTIHSIHFFINVIYSLFLMLQGVLRNSGIFRNQILYVLIGALVGYSGGAINYLTWYRVSIPPFLNFTVSIGAAFIAYAIIKHHLMDIKVAITRAGVFAVVYTLVLGLPFVVIKWLKPVLIPLLGENWWIIILIFGMALASAGPFIYNHLRKRAEDLLLKEQR